LGNIGGEESKQPKYMGQPRKPSNWAKTGKKRGGAIGRGHQISREKPKPTFKKPRGTKQRGKTREKKTPKAPGRGKHLKKKSTGKKLPEGGGKKKPYPFKRGGGIYPRIFHTNF